MRTATLTVILAVISTAAPQQDPPKRVADAPLMVLCAPDNTIQVGVAYNSAVVVGGGTGAYRFTIPGGALPSGLSLNASTGAISGTPTAGGTFAYTVQVTDSAGTTATTGTTPCKLELPIARPPATPPAAPGGTPPATAAPAAETPPLSAPAGKSPVVTKAEVDPATLASPRDKGTVKGVTSVTHDDNPFILGPEDQIMVLIYGSAEFSGAHMIRPDGRITMPFLGDVVAAGMAPSELGNAIKEKLKKYIVDPDVSVSVTAVNSKRYYIQGEVNKPGQYTLLVPTKVLEALVNAGGFRDFANQKKIVVMRANGERLNFNYKDVIKGKKMEQNVYLNPGDIIIVR